MLQQSVTQQHAAAAALLAPTPGLDVIAVVGVGAEEGAEGRDLDRAMAAGTSSACPIADRHLGEAEAAAALESRATSSAPSSSAHFIPDSITAEAAASLEVDQITDHRRRRRQRRA